MFPIKVVNSQKIVKVVLLLSLPVMGLSAGEIFCRELSCMKILTGSSVEARRKREWHMCREAYKPNVMVPKINSDEPKRRWGSQ